MDGDSVGLIILSERNLYRKKKHVSYDTVLGLEDEFAALDTGDGRRNILVPFSWVTSVINKLIRKIGGAILPEIPDQHVANICKRFPQAKVFYASMSYWGIKSNLATLKKIAAQGSLIIYSFDCWESTWEIYDELFRKIEPYALCFAYEKARRHFESLGYKNCWFMPQSMDVRFFHDYGEDKKRLFMQMGRRADFLHGMVLKYLEGKEMDDSPENYVYEKEKGRIIFPETELLAKEINSSYFFIAAPQCAHNEKVTGEISEVTARFYEAMACKSLIVGIKPKDTFDKLFPYDDAMIEVDAGNFAATIDRLLSDEKKYWEIVNRNYSYVMEHHRWRNRYEELIQLIEIKETGGCGVK